MARVSASNANFGFLVMALVLMLHPVVARLTPRAASHRLLTRNIPDQCFLTPLKVQYDGYKKLCEGDSEETKHHPCFTHWYGDLKSVDARPFLEPFDITKAILVKDDQMTDFTIDDPKKAFIIRYPNAGGLQVVFSNWTPDGCKDITLKRGDNSVWRAWASDDNEDDPRDVDTKHQGLTTKRLCSKWIHLHIKRDG